MSTSCDKRAVIPQILLKEQHVPSFRKIFSSTCEVRRKKIYAESDLVLLLSPLKQKRNQIGFRIKSHFCQQVQKSNFCGMTAFLSGCKCHTDARAA
jgi:hypothetical protein